MGWMVRAVAGFLGCTKFMSAVHWDASACPQQQACISLAVPQSCGQKHLRRQCSA